MLITHSALVGCTLQLSILELSLQLSLVVFCLFFLLGWLTGSASQNFLVVLFSLLLLGDTSACLSPSLRQSFRFSGSGRLLTPFQSSCGHRDTSLHSLIKRSTSTV